ncbi:MAG: S-adenosylmethionine:tRNA ribosyltransferase-isomerase [Ferruginibacter sp.]|nr:S-adenosylmethionine:tRNA ribosyltransferase-isomerase [Ferruginibacter sp.]
MTNPGDISILDYTYDLPDNRIALHPLEERDASRLLVYRDGQLQESEFKKLPGFLPERSLLVFNNTRVINARIRFKKTTGATIEIFCLEPVGQISDYASVMSATGSVTWKCLVGGAAKWKEEILEKELIIGDKPVILRAKIQEKITGAYIIGLSWEPAQLSFAEIIEVAGDVPLPPYIKRSAASEDSNRYQTIFAEQEGSVAAPTAGLHFTENIFAALKEKNISKTFVTLHVGAGTFKPVKADTMLDHDMHAEYIDVSAATIQQLIRQEENICAVGTTSLRTLESLYWLGVKAILFPSLTSLDITQWEVYQSPMRDHNFSAATALTGLLSWMEKNGSTSLFTQTQILIAPGYCFRIADMLITNFHQPQSTLLLLVAAAIGSDWKKMYNYALENDFRFLSYGDGNLIFING